MMNQSHVEGTAMPSSNQAVRADSTLMSQLRFVDVHTPALNAGYLFDSSIIGMYEVQHPFEDDWYLRVTHTKTQRIVTAYKRDGDAYFYFDEVIHSNSGDSVKSITAFLLMVQNGETPSFDS